MEKEIYILKIFRNILDATTETDCSELDKAITTIEEAMKHKTCDGCAYDDGIFCAVACSRRFKHDAYTPKDTQ